MSRSLSAVLLLSIAVAGCGGSSDPAADPRITGVVVDELGIPVAGAKVALLGTTVAAATTDLQGKFSFAGLGHAYDIAAAVAPYTAVAYLGLTRTDPTLTLPRTINVSTHLGHLLLSANPAQASSFAAPAAFIPPGSRAQYGAIAGSSAPIDVFLQWDNAFSTVTGTAVIFELVSNAFVRVGSATGAVLTDGLSTGFDVPMRAVTSGTISGTVAAADASQYIWNTELDARVEHVDIPISGQPSGGSFSIPAPIGSGFPLSLLARANDSFGGFSKSCRAVTPTSTGISLTVPLGPIQTAPPAGTVDVDGNTNFSWTDLGSVYRLRILRTSAPAYANNLDIYTTVSSAKIPDLSQVDFSLSAASNFNWMVFGSLPGFGVIGQTVDDTASAPWIVECGSTYTETALRSITTK